jgi:putative DNA primase/helicase
MGVSKMIKTIAYDVAMDIIYDKEKQVVKTNRENSIIYIYQNGYWEHRNTGPLIEKKIQSILRENTTKNLVNEILGHIKRETYFDPVELDANRRYLCLDNCVYDLERETTTPHSPDIFAIVKLPIYYDHTISITDIEKYVTTIVKAEDIQKLQEHLGDILSPHTASKKLLYVYGRRDSGKTTLLTILQTLLGEDNYCSLTLKQLGDRFTNFGLYGRMTNISSEVPFKLTLSNLEMIKAVTGGDTITLEQKFCPAFEYRPILKHIFASNGIPRIDLDVADSAFYRRFDFIYFPYSFTPDETVVSWFTTKEKKSAWFNWMIEGYHRLKDNHWQFTNGLSVAQVEELFRTAVSNDPFIVWLKERYIASPTGCVDKMVMFDDYKKYLEKSDVGIEYYYNYEYFCKRMLANPEYPVTSARRGPKEKQEHVFVGIEKK